MQCCSDKSRVLLPQKRKTVACTVHTHKHSKLPRFSFWTLLKLNWFEIVCEDNVMEEWLQLLGIRTGD